MGGSYLGISGCPVRAIKYGLKWDDRQRVPALLRNGGGGEGRGKVSLASPETSRSILEWNA